MTHRLFDELAHRYDLHTPPSHYQHDHQFVLSLARARPCTLLDVGCGTGVLIEKARRAGIEAFGVDSAPGMVQVANARLGRGIVEVRRMQELELVAAVDVAVSLSWTINYCADQRELEALLFRVHRALRPAGKLILQVAHAANAAGALCEDRERGPLGEVDDVTFSYRFSAVAGEPPKLRADYAYSCRSANESMSETHVLNCADAHLVLGCVVRAGFVAAQLYNSWRKDPFADSISGIIVADRG